LAIVLLAACIFRSYIPVGFMPAAGTPFLLELCPAYAGGIPAQHEHHHHAAQTHASFQNCPFGSAPAQGPVSDLIGFEPPGRASAALDISFQPGPRGVRPLHAHQPRGPPLLV
jgi:hypothetical protein